MRAINPFYRLLTEKIGALGGLFNAHMHLDRANTLADAYFAGSGIRILESSDISLQKKHALINNLHAGPAYETADLVARIGANLDLMATVNTTRADTMVDVTADRVGLGALETMTEIKRARAGEIDLRLGAYSPLGFKDSEPERWEVFEKGVAAADFIGCLPEADDREYYPDNIGFEEHCSRMLELARRHQCMLHVHTDQRNEASEGGTERLIEVVRKEGGPVSADGEPMIWAVHMVSPSTYEEWRHQRLVENLLEFNIGVICCPSAAIGMRQLRPLKSPTYNSIPRVLELLAAGVRVRLGSDNVADLCSPSTTADLIDEVFVLSAAVRFYQIDVLARLAAGQPLSSEECEIVDVHLSRNSAEIDKAMGYVRMRHAG